MQVLDIFNPQVSVVANGLEGKVILLYGGNSTGKTYQAVRMNKPFVLACESGLNAQNGIPFANIQTWADFLMVIKQLTNPATIDKAKELYSTIIIDEVYASAQFCQTYICNKEGVPTIGDGNGGYGLWQEYEVEYWKAVNAIVSSGYTVVFIAHATTDKDGKIIPKGDKRSITPIMDNCDIISFLNSNGVDENGKVIHSSAYFAETKDYFARSRFDYMVPFIEDFTAENLANAITDAIKAQEEAEGFRAVTFEAQKQNNEIQKVPFEELKEKVVNYGMAFCNAGQQDLLQEMIADCLGEGNSVQAATKRQYESLEILLGQLEDQKDKLGIEVA